ncbi:AAA family ATPase [Thioclava sp. FR2]|uniref:AAA family ATPase n=1 Tax=Thioclava sp. FR2 TaxID=3445780 RepID=UPI003EBA30B2
MAFWKQASTPAVAHEPPAWFEEFTSARLYARHLVLTGNIRDIYPVWAGHSVEFVDAFGAIARLTRAEGQEATSILRFDPVDGLSSVGAISDAVSAFLAEDPAKGWVSPLDQLKDIHARLAARPDLSVALVVDYASHLATGDDADLDSFFVAIDKLSYATEKDAQISPSRCVTVWLADEIGDLPAWFTIGNSALREVNIDLPDLEARFHFADRLARDTGIESGGNDPGRQWALQQFALESDGETLSAMRAIATVARFEGISLAHISDAIRIYRTGLRRNPWGSQVLADRVRHAQSLLGQRIKGQDHALERTVDILSRSLVGLSGAQSGARHSKPRGVMFFAGPTGVGKTELAKALTELLFGDETACHRFDMSEFMQEAAVTRLIGAPPGHPGHDRGGELVNAALHRPFSVFLFDEVEKAHPRVLDIFLQIIDEGRLTDARGATAHFSEALIIFTSNIGVMSGSSETNLGMNILPSDSHQELEDKIQSAIRDHFRRKLQRPELLNRIGPNIIVFDFLSGEAALEIFDAILARVIKAVKIERGIAVNIDPKARETLRFLCIEDFFEGGRGIGNRIERYFVNPLSREIFDRDIRTDFDVLDLSLDGDRTKLTLHQP